MPQHSPKRFNRAISNSTYSGGHSTRPSARSRDLRRPEPTLPHLLEEPLERGALLDGIPRRVAQDLVLPGETLEVLERPSPEFVHRRGRAHSLAFRHHWTQQRRGLGIVLVGPRNQIALVLALASETEDLLATGQVDFPLAELGFEFHATVLLGLNQLIDDAQGGDVARRGEVRAHAEHVNGRALRQKFLDAVFV